MALSDIVHQLSSTSHLGEAANEVRRNIAKMKAIPLRSYTKNLGRHVLPLSDTDKHSITDSDSELSYDWDSRSNATYEGAHTVGPHAVADSSGEMNSLSAALMSLASCLPGLYDAMCDIESYRLFTNDYRALLVLHDKLYVRKSQHSNHGKPSHLFCHLRAYIQILHRAIMRFGMFPSHGTPIHGRNLNTVV